MSLIERASAIVMAMALAGCTASPEPTDAAVEQPVAEATASAEAETDASMADTSGDALVPGTDYNATTIIDCGFDNAPPTGSCDAGVKRNWSERPGEHLVEVTKPDGTKRAIFFRGTEPFSADSAEADGSAGWDFASTRDGDRVTITYGPETYVVVDALVEGG